jgi:hypothetical protein
MTEVVLPKDNWKLSRAGRYIVVGSANHPPMILNTDLEIIKVLDTAKNYGDGMKILRDELRAIDKEGVQ